jgi:hypothetical protein
MATERECRSALASALAEMDRFDAFLRDQAEAIINDRERMDRATRRACEIARAHADMGKFSPERGDHALVIYLGVQALNKYKADRIQQELDERGEG